MLHHAALDPLPRKELEIAAAFLQLIHNRRYLRVQHLQLLFVQMLLISLLLISLLLISTLVISMLTIILHFLILISSLTRFSIPSRIQFPTNTLS
jgi:hypothetical protein